MVRDQRRLAAIVSADVAGYSRLMGRDESGTLAALKDVRREIVDPQIAARGGRIVKTTGDGLLLEFASVVDAVQCVIEVQTAMALKMSDVPEDRRIAFRIGVNIGDIIIDGDDIFGDGVNIAARLQQIAAPGGVCVSSRVGAHRACEICRPGSPPNSALTRSRNINGSRVGPRISLPNVGLVRG
jgi:class 3 adenylate cyclase